MAVVMRTIIMTTTNQESPEWNLEGRRSKTESKEYFKTPRPGRSTIEASPRDGKKRDDPISNLMNCKRGRGRGREKKEPSCSR